MSKLFIGYVITMRSLMRSRSLEANEIFSGLAWHTDDDTLRAKFSEFGAVVEAVRFP